jgi:ATP-dependent DNA helicase RecG
MPAKKKKTGLPMVDPLSMVPLRYEDRRKVTPSSAFVDGEMTLASGRVCAAPYEEETSRRSILIIPLEDSGGQFEAVYFRYRLPYYTKFLFRQGKEVCLWGKPKRNGLLKWVFEQPDIAEDKGIILPVYKTPGSVGARAMRDHIIAHTMALIEKIEDEVPKYVLDARGLPGIKEALTAVHLPMAALPDRRHYLRLAYREIMDIRTKIQDFQRDKAYPIKGDLADFFKKFSFPFTGDQKKAIAEIQRDMAKDTAMRSIVVGDVGCGKTVVAQAAAALCCQSNRRTLVLAPSVVLAGQLYDKFVESFGTELVSFMTGPKKTGSSLIVVGTTALLHKPFAGVGLVVIDEQHRFGVEQRNQLLGPWHALQMSATPIPRTVALMFHGAVKVINITELPFHRDCTTRVVSREAKPQILGHLRQMVNSGQKALIIYPLVEEDKGDYKAVEKVAEVWEKLYPDQVIWVHGRIDEKLDVVNDFRKSTKRKILLATSLIETGVDIPEASMLIVVGAEKFGLSQLHQLRGRVGRHGNKSYCYLISVKDEAMGRLKPLETISDGFKLSEVDSDLRGWGEVFTGKQSGHCFKLPDLSLYKEVGQWVAEDVAAVGELVAA